MWVALRCNPQLYLEKTVRDELILRWGNIKSYNLKTEKSCAALQRFCEAGFVVTSPALNELTLEQAKCLMDLIDCVEESGSQIYLEAQNRFVNAEEAKAYVLEYNEL